MTGKANTATLTPKHDRFTPEEIEDMQRRACKALMERALEIGRRDSRAQAAASVGQEASDDSNG